MNSPTVPPGFSADVVWNADRLRCGELILALRNRIRLLPSGMTLLLIAHDAGAREDISAWCRLTGNRLVTSQHPHYLIERKAE